LKIEIRRQTSNILIVMIEQVKVDIVNYPYPWIDNALNMLGRHGMRPQTTKNTLSSPQTIKNSLLFPQKPINTLLFPK
jgi:hypothetical protein